MPTVGQAESDPEHRDPTRLAPLSVEAQIFGLSITHSQLPPD